MRPMPFVRSPTTPGSSDPHLPNRAPSPPSEAFAVISDWSRGPARGGRAVQRGLADRSAETILWMRYPVARSEGRSKCKRFSGALASG